MLFLSIGGRQHFSFVYSPAVECAIRGESKLLRVTSKRDGGTAFEPEGLACLVGGGRLPVEHGA